MRAGTFLPAAFWAVQAAGAIVSYTGALSSPEDDSTQITVNLASAGSLSLRTRGFGGETNTASAVIPAGGFESSVPNAVFENNGTLRDGLTELTSGFRTGTGSNIGVAGTDNWTMEIATPGSGTAAPKPGGLWMCGIGAALWMAASRRRRPRI